MNIPRAWTKLEAVIKFYAAVVATVSLGWQIYDSASAHPVLQVIVESPDVTLTRNGDIYGPLTLTATLLNIGDRAVSVFNDIQSVRWPALELQGPYEMEGVRGIPI